MTIKTKVVWTAEQAQDPVAMQVIEDQAYTWEDRQTGGKEIFLNEPSEGFVTAFRYWATEAWAGEWVDFVLAQNAVSAIIEITP